MQRQIQMRRPVTVTDPEMVRYFMTVQEAVHLIIQAGSIGGRGEVFVLDMGHPVRILDLAYDLIRLSGLVPEQDVPVQVIGRRPGEKLKEDVLSAMEAEGATKSGHFRIARPASGDVPGVLKLAAQLRSAVGRDDKMAVTELLRQAMAPSRPGTARPQAAATELAAGGGH
jgi:FlaA1/EpsC-like NDP-sugar epimerase